MVKRRIDKKHNYIFKSKAFVLVFILFILCSYQKVFLIDFLDDLFIATMSVVYLAKLFLKKYIKRNLLICDVFLLFFGIVSLFNDSINDFFVFLKICIILFFCSEVYFYTKEDKMKALQLLLFISIPNLICGGYQYFISHIHGIHLLGKYDNVLGYRIQGFIGHPIHYSLVLLGLLVIVLFYTNKRIVQALGIVIITFLIKYTAAEFTYALAFICIGIFIIKEIILQFISKNIMKRMIIPMAIAFIILASGYLFYKMQAETNTIRYVSTMGTIKNTNMWSFFIGHGVGAFTKENYQEVYWIKVFYDMGIIGMGVLLNLLCLIIKQCKKNNNYYGILIIAIFILNMTINDGYMIPFIAMIPIFCARTLDEQKVITDSRNRLY